MKSLRVFCTSLCITLLPTLTCQAYAEDESVGAIFLNEAVGTRPTAMGEAYVAVPGDLNSIYWNSAGLIHSPPSAFPSAQQTPWV
jgi:hypothetical protein